MRESEPLSGWVRKCNSIHDRFCFPKGVCCETGRGDQVTRLELNKNPFMCNKSTRQHEFGEFRKKDTFCKVWQMNSIYFYTEKTLAVCKVKLCCSLQTCKLCFTNTHRSQLLDPVFNYIWTNISRNEQTILSERINFLKRVSIVNLFWSSHHQTSGFQLLHLPYVIFFKFFYLYLFIYLLSHGFWNHQHLFKNLN